MDGALPIRFQELLQLQSIGINAATYNSNTLSMVRFSPMPPYS